MRTLGRILRYPVNAAALRPLAAPFARAAGQCWSAPLPQLVGRANRYLADNRGVCPRSPLVLYEDGVPLGPAHSPRALIRDEGGGRFHHWYEDLLFSTPDGSDPNANGRSYAYSLSPWLFRRRAAGRALPAWVHKGRDPGDFPSDADRAEVAAAVRLGLRIVAAARDYFGDPAGKTALHLGAGWGYGAAMVLACHGLRPVVSDYGLVPWEEPYHSWYYRAVAEELARANPSADGRPLRALAGRGGYRGGALGRVPWPSDGDTTHAGVVDLVYSEGVFEHLADVGGTCRQLARLTRPGGLGLHRLNCRDAGEAARPLEYLLAGEAEFAARFAGSHGACGNRLRPSEIEARFREAGFEVLGVDAEELTRLRYVTDLLPRLRGAHGSPYRDTPPDDLRLVLGWCRVRKPRKAGNEAPLSGVNICAGSPE